MLQANLRAAKQLLRERGDDLAARSIRLHGRRLELEEQCLRFQSVIEAAMVQQSRRQRHHHHRDGANKINVDMKRMFERVVSWLRQRGRARLLHNVLH